MLHRDLKPENIMISNNTAIIIDFGLAVFMSEERGLEQFATDLTQEQREDIKAYLENNEYQWTTGGTLKLDQENKFQTLAILAKQGGTPNYMSLEAYGNFVTRGVDM